MEREQKGRCLVPTRGSQGALSQEGGGVDLASERWGGVLALWLAGLVALGK